MPPIDLNTKIQFADPMPDQVDVAIIGGGVAGIATAYFLTLLGEKVLVCEKGRIAGEQSSRNWGWIRQQGRDSAELPIMIESNRIWKSLAKDTGDRDLAFTQSGCLYLAKTQTEMAKYEAWFDLAKTHQLDTKLLKAHEIKNQFPNISGDWVGAMTTPSDGRGEPFVAIPALAKAAQRAGSKIIEECAVRTLDTEAGQVIGVFTEKGRVKCNRVVLAGGAWSNHFAANVDVDIPQLAVRGTVARTSPTPRLFNEKKEMPNIKESGFAIRRRADGGYTLATGALSEHFLSPSSFRYFTKFFKLISAANRDVRVYPAAPKGYPNQWMTKARWSANDISPFERMRVLDPKPNKNEVERMQKRLGERYPELAGIDVAESWAGMIDVTPDVVPILGEIASLRGFYVCTGLSGHGFGIGPGIGRVMANVVSGRQPEHDVSRFRTQRFTDGSPIEPGPY